MTSTLPDADEFAARPARGSPRSPGRRDRRRAVGRAASDSVAVFENWTAEQEREHTDRDPRLRSRPSYDAGWGALTWPEEYGGRGLPDVLRASFPREEDAFDVPRRTEMFSVTQQLVAPDDRALGHAEQQATATCGAMLRTDLHRLPAVLRDRGRAPTSPRSAPGPSATATALGARRAQGVDVGRPGRRPRASRCAAPTRTCAKHAGHHRLPGARWTRPASPCGRSGR